MMSAWVSPRVAFGIACLFSIYLIALSTTFDSPSSSERTENDGTSPIIIIGSKGQRSSHNINQQKRHCNTTWHLVVSGNDGYTEDLLTWWYHCRRVGLCCDPRLPTCCSTTTLYAEDEALFEKLQPSEILTVKKSWETGTGHVNFNLTGRGRFTYKKHWRFNHMMSRRPSLLCNELELHATNSTNGRSSSNSIVIFSDLDTFILQDPRPYLVSSNTVSSNDDSSIDFWGQDAQNSKTGPFNAGFMAFRSTPTTLSIIRQWRVMLENRVGKPSPNQMSFNRVVREHNDSVKAVLLPISQFQVGKSVAHYITNETILEPLDPTIVVFHNNWCDKGCDKVQRAKDLGLWHPVALEEVISG
jgi:hypothetical protein